MSDAVFELKNNEVTAPTQSEMGWHIMKVTSITPMKEVSKEVRRNKIISEIKKEKTYDIAYDVMTEIEDNIGAGKTLEEIAKDHSAKILKIKNLNEQGASKNHSSKMSNDFVETAFSYNENELSQAIETNSGFMILRVDTINESKAKDLDIVKNDIIDMWKTNERAAITQEIINDVTHDLDEGDSINEVASRFKLKLSSTKPLKRDDSIKGLTGNQMAELFQNNLGTVKIVHNNDEVLIVVPTKLINTKNKLSKDEIDFLRSKAQADTTQAMAVKLIEAYSANYDVEVSENNNI